MLISNKNYKKINNLFTFFKCELNNFLYINSNKEEYIFYMLILTFLFAYLLLAYKPPDTTDYHVAILINIF